MPLTSDVKLTEVWEPSLDGDIRAFTAAVAAETLADEQGQGFDKEPVTIVDGTYGADPESVKAFGKIEFAARVDVREAAEFVWQEIMRRSPVLSGRFQDSNVVMVNGSQVDDLTVLQPQDRITFTNTQPYAGKIERGESLMAPNGVYRAVASAARGRFKAVFVDFAWVKLDTGVRARTIDKRGKVGSRAVMFPSIQLYVSQDNTPDPEAAAA